MYCPNCGSQILDSSNFCRSCGAKVSSNETINKTENDSKEQNCVGAIICPQCGSHDILISEGSNIGICNSCNAKIVLSSNDTYNVFINSTEDDREIPFVVFNISPHYSAEDCKRFVLEELAKDDSPADIFTAKFSDPILKTHVVLSETVKGTAHYSVSIGYDKKEPYQATERYYDSSTKSTRERVVTRYRDIVEWSPFSGSKRISSHVFSDNNCDPDFDSDLLIKSIQANELEIIEDDKIISQFKINEAAHDAATPKHNTRIEAEIANSLPGDHFRQLDYHVDVDSLDQSIITVPCYYLNIEYNGNKYVKKFFPLGDYNVGGDNITGGLEESDSGIWGKIKITTILVCSIMIASIVLSATTNGHPIAGWSVLFAIGALVFHEIKYKKIREQLATAYLKKKEDACEKKKREWGL